MRKLYAVIFGLIIATATMIIFAAPVMAAELPGYVATYTGAPVKLDVKGLVAEKVSAPFSITDFTVFDENTDQGHLVPIPVTAIIGSNDGSVSVTSYKATALAAGSGSIKVQYKIGTKVYDAICPNVINVVDTEVRISVKEGYNPLMLEKQGILYPETTGTKNVGNYFEVTYDDGSGTFVSPTVTLNYAVDTGSDASIADMKFNIVNAIGEGTTACRYSIKHSGGILIGYATLSVTVEDNTYTATANGNVELDVKNYKHPNTLALKKDFFTFACEEHEEMTSSFISDKLDIAANTSVGDGYTVKSTSTTVTTTAISSGSGVVTVNFVIPNKIKDVISTDLAVSVSDTAYKISGEKYVLLDLNAKRVPKLNQYDITQTDYQLLEGETVAVQGTGTATPRLSATAVPANLGEVVAVSGTRITAHYVGIYDVAIEIASGSGVNKILFAEDHIRVSVIDSSKGDPVVITSDPVKLLYISDPAYGGDADDGILDMSKLVLAYTLANTTNEYVPGGKLTFSNVTIADPSILQLVEDGIYKATGAGATTFAFDVLENGVKLGVCTIDVSINDNTVAPKCDIINPYADGKGSANDPIVIDVSATTASGYLNYFKVDKVLSDFEFISKIDGEVYVPNNIEFGYPGFDTSASTQFLKRSVHKFIAVAPGLATVTVGVFEIKMTPPGYSDPPKPVLDKYGYKIYMELGTFDVYIKVIDSGKNGDDTGSQYTIASDKFADVVTLDLYGIAGLDWVSILPEDFIITKPDGTAYDTSTVKVKVDNILATDGREITLNSASRKVLSNKKVVPTGEVNEIFVTLVDESKTIGTYIVKVKVQDNTTEQMQISYTGATEVAVGGKFTFDKTKFVIKNADNEEVSGFTITVKIQTVAKSEGKAISSTASTVTGVKPGVFLLNVVLVSNGVTLGSTDVLMSVPGSEEI